MTLQSHDDPYSMRHLNTRHQHCTMEVRTLACALALGFKGGATTGGKVPIRFHFLVITIRFDLSYGPTQLVLFAMRRPLFSFLCTPPLLQYMHICAHHAILSSNEVGISWAGCVHEWVGAELRRWAWAWAWAAGCCCVRLCLCHTLTTNTSHNQKQGKCI